MFGLVILFLWISPSLRQSVTESVEAGMAQVALYSPYSYIALGLAVIAFVTWITSRPSGIR
jgi:hypothetical protein